MKKSNKKIFIIIGGIVIMLACMAITAIALHTFDPASIKDNGPAVTTKTPLEEAKALEDRAFQALKDGTPAEAKRIFQEARAAYEKINETERVANIDQQLFLINTPSPEVEIVSKPKLAGE